jgi:hypothetical protein
LIGATTVSLIGNIALAVLPYIPLVIVQIGALGYQTPSARRRLHPPMKHSHNRARGDDETSG